MSPELLTRHPYSGQSADLFAAAVILFIMITGRPPFQRALRTNPHYKPVAFGNFKRFWQIQNLDLSADLRDLFWRAF
jgi:serine/threonine protein kinase